MQRYLRVIPRDLFNEANLLKCLGALYIALETAGDRKAQFDVEDVDRFEIFQNPDDGSIYVGNLPFSINGRRFHLSRPLNSREPFPLYATESWPQSGVEVEPVAVFTSDGKLTPDFKKLITAGGENA